jgi:WS/DGAT/MGAT family acyltransferase
MGLMEFLLSPDPQRKIPEAPRFVPLARPSDAELARAWQRHRLKLPLRALGDLRSFLRRCDDLPGELLRRARAVRELAQAKLHPASETALNGPVGPHRLFSWLELPLDEIKAIKQARGCSVNDVVLAIASGALREFLVVRQERPEDLDFRVATPVDVRGSGDRGRFGNQVSSWIVPLPIGEADPLAQLDAIHRTTRRMKDSGQADAVAMMTSLRDYFAFDIQRLQRGTVNGFITNVPGPQLPLYMAGAKLIALYAQAPLIENLGLVVGATSYDGKLFFGLNADSDRVPDLDELTDFLRASAHRLAEATRHAAGAAEGAKQAPRTRSGKRTRSRAGADERAAGGGVAVH